MFWWWWSGTFAHYTIQDSRLRRLSHIVVLIGVARESVDIMSHVVVLIDVARERIDILKR